MALRRSSTRAVWAWASVVALTTLAGLAHADDTDAGVDAAAESTGFVAPQLQGSSDIPMPPAAPPISEPLVVSVKLLVNAAGRVQTTTLLSPPQPMFDAAVLARVSAFEFEPARYNGKPVAVEITFNHTFLPPPPAPSAQVDEGPPKSATLRGTLIELGTRAPVRDATVTAALASRNYSVQVDSSGRFELPLPEGVVSITVTAPAHLRFVQRETLAANQALAVTYFVERERYDPYEIVVVGEQRREEVSRVSLKGAEIKQVPGTFGDPFRVVQALPGVASVVSLLPFPVVRGSSPNATGYLLDGTRVPLLYHLLAGPSVIHPDFIDQVDFYPGGAPVPYGGYTGGIVDGRTARARPDEHLIDVDLNLAQVGAFVREPIPAIDSTVTVAGRYGYPGLLLSVANKQVSLSYWDYQLRIDGGNANSGWTVFAFGARDELDTPSPTALASDPSPPLHPTLVLGFHRVDLRLHQRFGRLLVSLRGVLGADTTNTDGTDFSVLLAEPSLRLRYRHDDQLTIAGGLEGAAHHIAQGAAAVATANSFAAITSELTRFYSGSAFLEAEWRPDPDWLVRPGVRADLYADPTAKKPAVDPRLTVRYRLAQLNLPDIPQDSDDSAVWLKASAGVYHQPPRFVLPLPGLDLMPLRYGLLRSFQTSFGVEAPLVERIQLSAEGYFNSMNPTLFDFSINDASVTSDANKALFPTSTVTDMTEQDLVNRLTHPQVGRSYGFELLLRRQAKNGLFGWVSYTLSRSERLRDGSWVVYDFDRSHLFNLVLGLPLPRNWDLGLRVQYQSGKPETITAGYNAARGSGYVRFDVRIDKRAVWKSWLLDFYVDITNVALLPEEVQPGTVLRYVLPTLGLRGRF